ncbi:carboxymuconolactone decarboxylase family protein [Herbaspirillum robiniae]|uniref:carboxymuconolactone decarboxylase family protein n=1 Tax=Herbaspirillum robiniae TaxID=2014887 RepID=UPI001EDC26A6|nr:carboxymuconolactone decarboxylase family protein [Herbaspirillum robiniae]
MHNKEQGTTMTEEQTLSARQQALVPVAAFAATGDLARLGPALRRALDAGLTVSETKETLVQMYAYAGFPRSLNALGELMKVVSERKQQGIDDAPGAEPGPAPTGDELLAAGTANQTRLSGAPVKGPLFDFAPAIDFFLKAHLFGDIFSRDNLDWRSRELATVSALSAMTGTEAQLSAHIRISMNVGLTAPQLRQAAAILGKEVDAAAGRRAGDAIDRLQSP